MENKFVYKNKNELIKNYFPACVDNFFNDPDLIKKYALSLKYEKDDLGRWPGERTKPLHLIDNELYMAIMLKMLSVYIDIDFQNVEWTNASLQFHKIKSFDNENLNKGWVHTDIDYELAGLVYLNQNVNLNTGTSIYKLKKGETYSMYERHYEKHLFLKGENIKDEDYINSLKNNLNKFEETINFSNVYNRFICYDAKEYHTLNGIDNTEERLTLLLFADGLKIQNKKPLQRVKNNSSFDNFIENRIKNYYV